MLTTTRTFDYNIDAYNSHKYRYIINQGGSSSSKTFSILQLLILIALSRKNLTIDITSESLPHLKRGVLRDFPQIFEQLGYNFDLLFNRSDNFIKLDNGTKINFIALDNPGKARGSRRDILFINEANLIPYETAQQLFIRTHKTIFIDYNPTNAFWVHTEIIPKNRDKSILIKSTYKDNQLLSPATVAELESRKGNNNFWRVYGLGELGIAEGLIFDNVEAVRLSNKDIQAFGRCQEGIDWGYSIDPFVFVQLYYNRKKRSIYIFNEIYKVGLSNEKAIAEIKKNHIKSSIIIADSEEPKSVKEFQNAGLPVKSAKKGAGSVSYGIKKLLGLEHIYIDTERCPNAYREFINYAYEKDRNGNTISEYPDKDNHTIDAVRYALEDEFKY